MKCVGTLRYTPCESRTSGHPVYQSFLSFFPSTYHEQRQEWRSSVSFALSHCQQSLYLSHSPPWASLSPIHLHTRLFSSPSAFSSLSSNCVQTSICCSTHILLPSNQKSGDLTSPHPLHYELNFYSIYTSLQKFGNALENGVLDNICMNSFLICDNFALIRDNTNYENILLLVHKQFIYRKN